MKPPEAAFPNAFRDNFLPEVVSDLISGVAIEHDGVDVLVKFGDSRPSRSRDIRAAHFVMDDDERTTADTGHDIRQKRHSAFRLKIA